MKYNIKKFRVQLSKLMDKYNFELIEFSYHRKIFGNIFLKIRINGKELSFITDRGEIYCNNEFLCDYEYIRNEEKTTPQKLLELMEIKIRNL